MAPIIPIVGAGISALGTGASLAQSSANSSAQAQQQSNAASQQASKPGSMTPAGAFPQQNDIMSTLASLSQGTPQVMGAQQGQPSLLAGIQTGNPQAQSPDLMTLLNTLGTNNTNNIA